MEKTNVSRRDFIKATAATGAVAAAALVTKEVIGEKGAEASLDDLQVAEEPAQMSCLDLLEAARKKL